MTLTSVLPTLRRSIPDPLDPDRWPEHTRATVADVVVAGVSMCRLVELCGTPCVHTAAASLPGTGGRPSPVDDRAVAVMTVAAVRVDDGTATIDLDAAVDDIGACWPELRLLGRASVAHERHFLIARTGVRGAGSVEVTLPGDLVTGDVLVVPCEAPLSLSRLRR
ncbi:hypothetical protein ACFWN7_12570 [Agromyces sp. NPDC058484]|uniref:hypothetical protein n=1 Tax=Agromyces sp. NPDC058484 TaxID=3346524 RepID=UPI003664662A